MTPQTQVSSEQLALAKQQLALSQEQIRQLVEANKGLLEGRASDTIYEAYGPTSFATAFIWGTCGCKLTFADDYKLRFYGEYWGVGFGAGTSYGAAVFAVSPPSLLGGCTFQVSMVAAGPGGVVVNFLRDNMLLGTFVGPAIGVGASNTGGHGVWTTSQEPAR